VNNQDGVVFSHAQKGESFNAPYKHIERDWFFHNPTRANVGSLGRVGDVPAEAVTSPEYQVWRITNGLTPDFVEILIRLPFFLDLVQCHRVGAVKERLFVENLREIPVPPLDPEKQTSIVELWRSAQVQIAAASKRVEILKARFEAEFLTALGFKLPDLQSPPKFFAADWKGVERWSVGFNQQALAGLDLSTGTFPSVTLGSITSLLQYGTSEKANTHGKGFAVLRMNNIKDGELALSDIKHIELPPREADKLQLKKGDILFNRTNSKELVGKCAVFHEETPWVFASYLIRVRLEEQRACPDFVTFVLNGRIGRQQIDALSRQIIGQANINSGEIRSLRIPLPPLKDQRNLVERVTTARAEIARERAAVAELRQTIAAQVESLILGTQPLIKV
jgi:type I restriction enzyme S subunit